MCKCTPEIRTPLEYGDPAYTIRVTRLDYKGRTKHFEFDGYGVLRELMDDVEAEAEKRGWFEETSIQVRRHITMPRGRIMRERISIATYLAARQRLLWHAICCRQWAKSDPKRADHWVARLKTIQRQLLSIRQAERLPMLAQGGGCGL